MSDKKNTGTPIEKGPDGVDELVEKVSPEGLVEIRQRLLSREVVDTIPLPGAPRWPSLAERLARRKKVGDIASPSVEDN